MTNWKMRGSEWIKERNGADLECLQKLSKLMITFLTLVKMNPTKKCVYEWKVNEVKNEDEVIRNYNELKKSC